MTSTVASEPQRYLEAQISWRPVEIAFWLAALTPFVLTPNYLVLASQIAKLERELGARPPVSRLVVDKPGFRLSLRGSSGA